MGRIRVLLADDHAMVRQGVRALLEAEAFVEVVGEAADGREAIAKAEELRPDIVITDIGMPGLNGLEATRRIASLVPPIKVLVLTMYDDERYVQRILRAGASGYVLKQAVSADLVTAIQSIWQGESYLSPAISKKLINAFVRNGHTASAEDPYDLLTDREREVLQLVAEGHTNREIAELIYVGVKTVETHRANVMDKLGVRGLASLVRFAISRGLIAVDPA